MTVIGRKPLPAPLRLRLVDLSYDDQDSLYRYSFDRGVRMQDEFAKAAAEYCQPEKKDIPQLRQPFCDPGSIKTVNLQKSVDDKFEKLAAQHNVPAESLLRDAVRQHLGRKAAKPTRQASA